ncbi:uncharacterized protein LOC143922224 [Arctopsyche grandis]|uniref:uncharacterized protein LOC143922224 n=1 Tax=Arctopsyche grandis TaxID=121162 RepID=UPI00406D99F5
MDYNDTRQFEELDPRLRRRLCEVYNRILQSMFPPDRLTHSSVFFTYGFNVNQLLFEIHLRREYMPDAIQCLICGKRSYRRKHFLEHLFMKHEIKDHNKYMEYINWFYETGSTTASPSSKTLTRALIYSV